MNVPKYIDINGRRAIIWRMNAGHLCGYLEIASDSPLYEKDYHKPLPCLAGLINGDTERGKRGAIPWMMQLMEGLPAADAPLRPEMVFDVHGSLTFSGKLHNHSGWWIGFDCNHSGDDPETCDEVYVESELRRLEEQVTAVEKKISTAA